MNDYPDTPAQRWAEEHHDDSYFRIFLGEKSLEEWWQVGHDKAMVAMLCHVPIPRQTCLDIAIEICESCNAAPMYAGRMCLNELKKWLGSPNQSRINALAQQADVSAIEAERAGVYIDAQATKACVAACAITFSDNYAGELEAVVTHALAAGYTGYHAKGFKASPARIIRKYFPECPIRL